MQHIQQPQMTREQLFEQELQAKITPLLKEIPYKEKDIFKCLPSMSVNQVLEHYSGTSLKGLGRSDYKELSDGELNCHNVRFVWELVSGLTPQQLNVDPKTYLELLTEANERVENIHNEVIEKDVLDKIKVDINNQFALIEKKVMEQRKPGNSVIPNGKR